MSIFSRVKGVLRDVSDRLFKRFGSANPSGKEETVIVRTRYGVETLNRNELGDRGYNANDVIADSKVFNRYTDIYGKVIYDRNIHGYRDALTGRKVSRETVDSAYNQHRAEVLANMLYNKDPKRSSFDIANIIKDIEELRRRGSLEWDDPEFLDEMEIDDAIRNLISP